MARDSSATVARLFFPVRSGRDSTKTGRAGGLREGAGRGVERMQAAGQLARFRSGGGR